jgi:lysophospholipid acyltransferase (LPLAT)-like uncharacterized protein
MEMSRKTSNRAASRIVLKRVKEGVSIGMTGDGPLGPALELKDAPIDWARATGLPVFAYAFATTRGRRLKTWDQMLLPNPFGRGAYVFRRYAGVVPRDLAQDQRDRLRTELEEWLSQTTHYADALVERPPGP